MSIHFVSGKPGAGKSFYGVKLAFEELRYGDRHIVTNLPLLVGELNKYYHEHYADDSGLRRYKIPWWIPRRLAGLFFWMLPEALVFRVFPLEPGAAERRMLKPVRDDICGRIHLITDEEMSVFFTKRPDAQIEHVANDAWKKGARPDYSVVKDHGVFFILDEVHIAFNSRAWAETGAEVLYYLSQHRKLGDDVICITQSVGNVDKQFRSVAQDFTYIRNLAKETFGHFRLPARFIRKTYSQPPAGDKAEPMEMGSFTLDVNGLAKCYDTAKGVGIHGRAGADKGHRKKGIHWMWFAAGLPIVVYLFLHFTPRLFVGILGKRPVPAVKAPAVPALAVDTSHGTRLSEVPSVAETQVSSPPWMREKQPTSDIFCRGYTYIAGEMTVFLSDGTVYESADGEVGRCTKRWVTVNGKVYLIKAAPAWTEYTFQAAAVEGAWLPPPGADDQSQSENVQVTTIGRPVPRAIPGHNGFQRMGQSQTSSEGNPSAN